MGVTSTALLLACLALVAYDSSTARTTLTRDIGMLADVVSTTSTAAVSFSDAKGASETLDAVAANKNVRMAAIVRAGAVLARFDRRPDTASISILSRVPAELLRAPRSGFTMDRDSLRLVRPIFLDRELIGAVYLESDLDGLHARLRNFLSIIALVLSGALAVAFVLSSKLQRLISGPILRLTTVTQAVLRGAAGNLSATRLAECAGALELMVENGAFDAIAADTMLARLEAESTRFLAALRAGLVAQARHAEP